MVKNIITIHGGQCGNQIAHAFWTLLLEEHIQLLKQQQKPPYTYSQSVSRMFANVDTRACELLGVGSEISSLKARAVLFDMEENVLGQLLRSPLGPLFDEGGQTLTSVSGSGNNWAVGYHVYGPQYGESISELIRWELEKCDEGCDSFLMFNSVSGGTGSGLGSYIGELLRDEFPGISRIAAPVIPSFGTEAGDVVTAPYNTALAMRSMSAFADMIVPVNNVGLSRIGSECAMGAPPGRNGWCKFEDMNRVIGRLWVNLTSSHRLLDKERAVALSQVVPKLVGGGDRRWILPSVGPTSSVYSKDIGQRGKAFDEMFAKITKPSLQVCPIPKMVEGRRPGTTAIKSAVLVRTQFGLAEVERNMKRNLQPNCHLLSRVDVTPNVGSSSIVLLENSSLMGNVFNFAGSALSRLWRRKAHAHHYTEYMEESAFAETREELKRLELTYLH